MSRRPRPFSPEDFGEQGANGQGTGSFLALDEANGAGPEATFGRRFGEAKHSARLDLDVAGETRRAVTRGGDGRHKVGLGVA